MPRKTERQTKEKAMSGLKPGMLKLNGNWWDAIKKTLGKKRPANGWPK